MHDYDHIMSDMGDVSVGDVTARTLKITVLGEHLVRVEEIKIEDSSQINATYFVVGFRVVETTASAEVKIGELYSWTCDLLKRFGKKQVGKAHAKRCLAAIAGLDPDSEEANAISGADFDEATSEDQPYTGRLVRVRTEPRKTKPDESGLSRPWTFHDWHPHLDA